MTDNNTLHCCNNCRFYAEHYIKRDTKFIALSQGHCGHINRNVRKLIRNPQFTTDCDKWQSKELTQIEQKKSIKKLLTNIEKSLASLAEVLNNDS
ncbi:hypothetical protein [Anaerocaecibacter muris]|uniref:hypothetical protein n=1 Tax=Anaerocaecibacter muris TaxID=2941513 RepID=UPI003F6941DF